jgi:hypothetical protein
MKYIICSCFIIAIFSNAYCQQIDINKLKKDPILIEYKKILNELKSFSNSRKYKLPLDPELSKDLAANPTKEGMIIVLKKRGMENAEEYVDKISLQTSLMFEFMKKHPEISKLDQKKKLEVLKELLLN